MTGEVRKDAVQKGDAPTEDETTATVTGASPVQAEESPTRNLRDETARCDETTDEPPRRGRRLGNPDTRNHIAQTASRLFLRDGFHKTSLRAVARAAKVDPSLIHHYFPSKERLFFESLRIGIDPDKVFKQITDPGTFGIGRRLAAFIVSLWESPVAQDILGTFFNIPGIVELYGSVVEQQINRAFDIFLPSRPSFKNETLAQIQAVASGMVLTRYILQLDAPTSLGKTQAIKVYGDLIQEIVDKASTQPS